MDHGQQGTRGYRCGKEESREPGNCQRRSDNRDCGDRTPRPRHPLLHRLADPRILVRGIRQSLNRTNDHRSNPDADDCPVDCGWIPGFGQPNRRRAHDLSVCVGHRNGVSRLWHDQGLRLPGTRGHRGRSQVSPVGIPGRDSSHRWLGLAHAAPRRSGEALFQPTHQRNPGRDRSQPVGCMGCPDGCWCVATGVVRPNQKTNATTVHNPPMTAGMAHLESATIDKDCDSGARPPPGSRAHAPSLSKRAKESPVSPNRVRRVRNAFIRLGAAAT